MLNPVDNSFFSKCNHLIKPFARSFFVSLCLSGKPTPIFFTTKTQRHKGAGDKLEGYPADAIF